MSVIKFKDGGPVYPVSTLRDEDDQSLGHHDAISDLWRFAGITLRDHFATSAFQALLAVEVPKSVRLSPDEIARRAWEYADAMIQAK